MTLMVTTSDGVVGYGEVFMSRAFQCARKAPTIQITPTADWPTIMTPVSRFVMHPLVAARIADANNIAPHTSRTPLASTTRPSLFNSSHLSSRMTSGFRVGVSGLSKGRRTLGLSMRLN